MKLGHETSGSTATDADADVATFDPDGFTLNWTTADATAREIFYVALASGNGGGIQGSGTAGQVTKFDGATTVADSLLYSNETDVGIGTTNPDATFHVEGDGLFKGSSNGDEKTSVDNTGSGNAARALFKAIGDSSDVSLGITSSAYSQGSLLSSDQAFLVAASAGNGLLIYTDSGHVTVEGAANSNDYVLQGVRNENSDSVIQLINTNTFDDPPGDPNKARAYFIASNSVVGDDGTWLAMGVTSEVYDNASQSTETKPKMGFIGAFAENGLRITTENLSGPIVFGTDQKDRMWLDKDEARLLIGMSSTDVSGCSLITAGCITVADAIVNASILSLSSGPSSVSGVHASRTGTGTFLPLTFNTSNSERMRVHTGGNVSIGTTSDNGFKLEVNGSLKTSTITSTTVGDEEVVYSSTNALQGSTNHKWDNSNKQLKVTGRYRVLSATRTDPTSGTSVDTYYDSSGASGALNSIAWAATLETSNMKPMAYAAEDHKFFTGSTAAVNFERLRIENNGNIGISGASFGSGVKVLFIADGTAPSSNPSGGGILYVESGALKYRGSSGTVTTVASA